MGWITIRRETGLIEHVCEHGVGHPNDGSIQYMDWYWRHYEPFVKDNFKNIEGSFIDALPVAGPHKQSAWGVHGCDGCCGLDEFPGRASNAIAHAWNEMDEEERKTLRKDHFLLWWGIMAAINEAVPE